MTLVGFIAGFVCGWLTLGWCLYRSARRERDRALLVMARIKAGTFGGFQVAGRGRRDGQGVIRDFQVESVSLVDRPGGPPMVSATMKEPAPVRARPFFIPGSNTQH